MREKTKHKAYGYHIAQSRVNPNTLYLGENDSFVSLMEAKFFMSHFDAQEYAKKIKLVLGDIRNVIVLCECDEHMRSYHKF